MKGISFKNNIIKGVVIISILTTSFFVASGEKVLEYSTSNTAAVENRILAVAGADLDIAPYRVAKSAVWAFNFLSPVSLEQRKTNLVNALCKEVGADILVDPQFTYSRRVLGSGKLTVTGYPANYRDFRSLSETEIDSLILKKDTTLQNRIIFINR